MPRMYSHSGTAGTGKGLLDSNKKDRFIHSHGMVILIHKDITGTLYTKRQHGSGYTWKSWTWLGTNTQGYILHGGRVNTLSRTSSLSCRLAAMKYASDSHMNLAFFKRSVPYRKDAIPFSMATWCTPTSTIPTNVSRRTVCALQSHGSHKRPTGKDTSEGL